MIIFMWWRWIKCMDVLISLISYGFVSHGGVPAKSEDTTARGDILYTYIYMTYYKSLISILSTCKYVTSSHDMSSFFIEKYF
jgi:hypothetical protein